MITIFTPTYNRGYIIEKLYLSLCNQTSNEFEWLVVDDGSTDNTRDLIERFIADNKINLKNMESGEQNEVMLTADAVFEYIKEEI